MLEAKAFTWHVGSQTEGAVVVVAVVVVVVSTVVVVVEVIVLAFNKSSVSFGKSKIRNPFRYVTVTILGVARVASSAMATPVTPSPSPCASLATSVPSIFHTLALTL